MLQFVYGDAPFPRGIGQLNKFYWETPRYGCAIMRLQLTNRHLLMRFLLRSRASLTYGYLTPTQVFWNGLKSRDRFFTSKAMNFRYGMERTDCVSFRSGPS